MNRLRIIVAFAFIACFLFGCASKPIQQPGNDLNASKPPQKEQETDIGSSGSEAGDTEEKTAWEHEATLLRFLEETNRIGVISGGSAAVPPGTLPEIQQIPAASQTLLGKTVPIVLARKQQAISFYYSCQANGIERLAVFIPAEKIPMLMILESALGGVNALYDCIQGEKVFQVKILAIVNVSYEEGNIYAYNIGAKLDGIPEQEILREGTNLKAGECIGVIGTNSAGVEVNVLKGSTYGTASNAFRENVDWMKEKFNRYSLGEYIG